MTVGGTYVEGKADLQLLFSRNTLRHTMTFGAAARGKPDTHDFACEWPLKAIYSHADPIDSTLLQHRPG